MGKKPKETTFSQVTRAWMIKSGVTPENADAAIERARRKIKLNKEERKFLIGSESDKPNPH